MYNLIINILENILMVLKDGGEEYYYQLIRNILDDKAEDDVWKFIISNDLWGGSGSISDQALLDNKDLRIKLEMLLIELGNMQMRMDKVNPRTKMWVSSFLDRGG